MAGVDTSRHHPLPLLRLPRWLFATDRLMVDVHYWVFTGHWLSFPLDSAPTILKHTLCGFSPPTIPPFRILPFFRLLSSLFRTLLESFGILGCASIWCQSFLAVNNATVQPVFLIALLQQCSSPITGPPVKGGVITTHQFTIYQNSLRYLKP